MKPAQKIIISLLALINLTTTCNAQTPAGEVQTWPTITYENKPWTRWWWHGSTVTKEGITAELEAFKAVGLGGVEITPIYGVYGYENKFINYLSPEWVELLMHVLKEGERLGIGVDMATGTGWPFGGPWVSDEDACKNFRYKMYNVNAGSSLQEKVEYIQEPLLRTVGNFLYEVNASPDGVRQNSSTDKEPVNLIDVKSLKVSDLVQPIAENKNLQALAIDQVQFERPIPLKVLMAYGDKGKILDLTKNVDSSGKLNWTAPSGKWKLYAIFEGWHGKMVERAGPGGEGNVIDHFSSKALKNYLHRFDSALEKQNINSLRAFFNDSYEVDDAKGTANWTPELFEEFKKRRGYDLREYLPELLSEESSDANNRVLCDYRETISELVLHNFTKPWKEWAHTKSAMVRNQAHGSPSNILDLYTVVDIPEIEGIEPLRIKMASSAGNVSGKKLVSAEAATWLNEHFESNLADVKVALDRFMLHGVNHLVYHGTAYSPRNEPWPGWLFYAAVHFNDRNPFWNDFDALNEYVSRCQSFLQNSISDNDVLLYYPIYDRFSTKGPEMIEHFDGVGKQFEGTSFARSATEMLQRGYSFDYISDNQILQLKAERTRLTTAGNATYKTIVVPHCKYIPIKTFEKLNQLAKDGAFIIFHDGLPESFSGFSSKENEARFQKIKSELNNTSSRRNVLVGDKLEDLLEKSKIKRESFVDEGIHYIRKKDSHNQILYFINNTTERDFAGWIPLNASAKSISLFNPMNGNSGLAQVQSIKNGKTKIYIQLKRQQSLIIKTTESTSQKEAFPFYNLSDTPVLLNKKWKVQFVAGGPTLPKPLEMDTLTSWTNLNEKTYKSFSGRARYESSFDKPKSDATHWLLDLGAVKESADVFLNGDSIGTLIGPNYSLVIPSHKFQIQNKLEVVVSNLMANRIADMDANKIFWKKFYNVNFPARKPENRKNGLFDASAWAPKPSGLIGPVQLIALKKQ